MILLFCATLGCAGMYRAGYRNEYIRSQMQGFVHTADFTALWTTARTMLFEAGYMVRDSGNGYNVETEWARTDVDTMRRYLLVGYTNPDGTGSIQFNYVEQRSRDGAYPSQRTGRDYDMEYELLRRVDLSKWQQIEMDATDYANRRMAERD